MLKLLHSAPPTPLASVYDHNHLSGTFLFISLPSKLENEPLESRSLNFLPRQIGGHWLWPGWMGEWTIEPLGAKVNSRQFPRQSKPKDGMTWWAGTRTRRKWMRQDGASDREQEEEASMVNKRRRPQGVAEDLLAVRREVLRDQISPALSPISFLTWSHIIYPCTESTFIQQILSGLQYVPGTVLEDRCTCWTN